MLYDHILQVLDFISTFFFICQVIVVGYFAHATNHELRPYFERHNMENEVRHAKLVYGYWCGMAGIAAVNSVTVSVSTSHKKRLVHRIAYAFALSSWASVMGLGIAVSVYVSNWWKLFEERGLEHLMRLSQGIAATVIGILVLGWLLMSLNLFGALKSRLHEEVVELQSRQADV